MEQNWITLENSIVELLVEFYKSDRNRYKNSIEDCLELLKGITERRIFNDELTYEYYEECIIEYKDILRLYNIN